MDYQKIVDDIGEIACVVSVELKENGGYGDLRIVAGNKAYIDTIEHPLDDMPMQKKKFVPNMMYTEYVPGDLDFEQYCYRAAAENKCLHSSSKSDNFGLWFDMTFIPLASDRENVGYCLFITELSLADDSTRITAASVNLTQIVLRICIKMMGTKDFQTAMNDVIRDIRDLCDARRCCVALMDTCTRTFEILCEAQKSDLGLPPIKDMIWPEFYDLLETWEDTLAGSNGLIICNEQDMQIVKERNPEWYDSLVKGGVESLILYPVKSQGTLLGYMWATNFDVAKAAGIREILELSTFILGSKISNHQLLERFRILSTKDLLTGVQNRNRMNHYVEQLSNEKPGSGRNVGVVFADLNDLKTVNDFNGHEAGDRLLKDAALVLMEVFDAETIFRAGGDEFTVILKEVTEEELEELVAKVREVSARGGKVSFAIGFDVAEDVCEVRAALRRADEKMYEDKKQFYELHPEKRRTPGLS